MENKNTLSSVIDASGLKRQFLASELGLSRSTFRDKVNGRRDWKLSELLRLKQLLHMDDSEFWPLVTGGNREEETK